LNKDASVKVSNLRGKAANWQQQCLLFIQRPVQKKQEIQYKTIFITA